MRIKAWTLSMVVGLTVLFSGRGDARAEGWTGWISDGSNHYTYCDWDEGISAFGCSGSYCDNVRLYCQNLLTGMTLDSGTDHFTTWFSEETGGDITVQEGEGFGSSHRLNERYCNSHVPGTLDAFGPAVVAGYQCSGSYCDNQQLECVVPKHDSDWSWGSFTECAWTSTWFSEETGTISFGKYLVGVRCSGSYCDNKQFYTCAVS